MILQNKLGLTNEAELARAEEKLSKTRALELYDTGLLDTFEVGTFKGLAADRESTRLNSSHNVISRMPSSA